MLTNREKIAVLNAIILLTELNYYDSSISNSHLKSREPIITTLAELIGFAKDPKNPLWLHKRGIVGDMLMDLREWGINHPEYTGEFDNIYEIYEIWVAERGKHD